jgi:wyosine [tRNA(Phe)-imidazoG37] synthetase (radical SAM superfamily)
VFVVFRRSVSRSGAKGREFKKSPNDRIKLRKLGFHFSTADAPKAPLGRSWDISGQSASREFARNSVSATNQKAGGLRQKRWSAPSTGAPQSIREFLRMKSDQTIPPERSAETAFGYPAYYFDNRFVYAVVSPRARGLSLGIDFNPDKKCNHKCVYCEIDRTAPPRSDRLDMEAMASELTRTLELVRGPGLLQHSRFKVLPPELLALRHVALSGSAEPTLSQDFVEAVETVTHVRACRSAGFFKIVLVTNGSGLHLPGVANTLNLFTSLDEIWIKLDAGTQEGMARVNQPDRSIEQLTETIIRAGRKRPIVIQSLFVGLDGPELDGSEIQAYAKRLARIKKSGAKVSSVQIYSATRPRLSGPPVNPLSLKCLTSIARAVRKVAGLPAEVY